MDIAAKIHIINFARTNPNIFSILKHVPKIGHLFRDLNIKFIQYSVN